MKNNKSIRYLSLAAKAGKIISGMDECEKTARKGKGGLFILAADAGGNTRHRAEVIAAQQRIRLIESIYTKSELAAAIGRGSAVSIALLTDDGLAGAFAAAHATEQEERI